MTDKQTDRLTYRLAARRTGSQPGSQADRHTDRQTGRQTHSQAATITTKTQASSYRPNICGVSNIIHHPIESRVYLVQRNSNACFSCLVINPPIPLAPICLLFLLALTTNNADSTDATSDRLIVWIDKTRPRASRPDRRMPVVGVQARSSKFSVCSICLFCSLGIRLTIFAVRHAQIS